jgi:hypothetical protein
VKTRRDQIDFSASKATKQNCEDQTSDQTRLTVRDMRKAKPWQLFRFRLRPEQPLRRQRIEDLRISLRPGIVDDHPLKPPFLVVAHEIAVIAIHQQRVLRSWAWTFPRHEMLRHHVCVKCGGIFTDIDLKIVNGVTGVERAEQGNQRVDDRLATGEFRKIETELSAGRPKVEKTIFCQRRRERIRIAVIETKGEAMQSIRNLIAVGSKLREISAHGPKFKRGDDNLTTSD